MPSHQENNQHDPDIQVSIVLATLNAKYIHASLGLRYLLANMGELRQQTVLREFTTARDAREIAEELLDTLYGPHGSDAHGPRIIGFGVYIWNVLQTSAVIRRLKAVRPDLRIVLGGPEVSYELDGQEIVALADHVITGWGDLSFASLCRAVLNGSQSVPAIIVGEQPSLDRIALPYAEYTDSDLAHRLLYVEASRGCPFKCEFCLSAIDRTARAFDTERFLEEMHLLYRRGARNYKFVDRTFNLKIDTAIRILQFFLERLDEKNDYEILFVHFEVVPDHLPDPLRRVIARFPPGVLQFEIGIQTFNAEVQQRISRWQDPAKTEESMRWLAGQSNVHVHADLIFGLPGETLESFASGFDRLYAMKPHEIQLGFLKRLRGAPIVRHTAAHAMVYDSMPPYVVQQTSAVDSCTVQRLTRFARYWDKVANSGRFSQTLALWLGRHACDNAGTPDSPSPFYAFIDFSDWLEQRSASGSGLSPEWLTDALFDYLVEQGLPTQAVHHALLGDYLGSGARGSPQSLRGMLTGRPPVAKEHCSLLDRQARHRAGQQPQG